MEERCNRGTKSKLKQVLDSGKSSESGGMLDAAVGVLRACENRLLVGSLHIRFRMPAASKSSAIRFVGVTKKKLPS